MADPSLSSLRGSRSALAVALAATLLVAGCSGPIGGGESTATPTAEGGADARATPTPPTQTPTAVPDRPSPWGEGPIVVGVAGSASDRNFVPLVERATAYWERNAERYAGYPVSFRVRPDAAHPDVRVRFVEDVPRCDAGPGARDVAGCAPYVTEAADVGAAALPVYVQTGLSDASTVRVLRHEFGHLLGLGHGDAPRRLMRPSATLYTTPKPNATERAFPWNDSRFGVYVAGSGVDRPATVRSQIDHALAYYEDGAPGMPGNLTFHYVDDPANADVVVRFRGADACRPGSDSVSCVSTRGPDLDGDGAIETYSRATITLGGIDADAVGWHVGNWLAYALGAEDPAARPPPFRDASYRERRSAWWQ